MSGPVQCNRLSYNAGIAAIAALPQLRSQNRNAVVSKSFVLFVEVAPQHGSYAQNVKELMRYDHAWYALGFAGAGKIHGAAIKTGELLECVVLLTRGIKIRR